MGTDVDVENSVLPADYVLTYSEAHWLFHQPGAVEVNNEKRGENIIEFELSAALTPALTITISSKAAVVESWRLPL